MKRIALPTLAVAALAFAACTPKDSAPKKSPDAVKVEFFVMSQCPFGVQVVDAVKEVVEKMGPDIDFSIDFIGTVGANDELTSMHGETEVKGDIVQLCAMKYSPAKYLEMIACQNKTMREVATNWEKCATDAQLPVDKIKTCFEGQEGKDLLKASFTRAQEKKATGSPTIFLAGKPYTGRRGTTDFFRSFCGEHKDPKPAACQNIPEPAKVNVTVLSDKRCTDCNTERYVNMLKFRLANPVIKEIDYSDDEGKKLFTEVNGTNLPLVLFDATLDGDKEAAGMFGRHLKPMGNYRSLEVGAAWSPVCMNEGGCELEQCKNTLACRKDAPNKLEVFVMSQCPYGVRALNAMEEVLKNFDKKLDFEVHFIANGTAKDGFNALHGQPEVDENIRELCAIKLHGKNHKYMDYVLCRNKDIRSDKWETCTGGATGIDTKKMQKCIESEGKQLLENDIKVANGLGIGASPTWLANGKYKFSGIDADTIKRNLCQYNKDLKGCDNTLSGPAQGAPVQGGCGQ